ncbi:MAG: MazG-like family protein [Chloroflexota bacterium]|nr:MazG-like family protein [Chloroflexota bacterium]
MTIEELQTQDKELNAARGWVLTTPEERALWLTTEVGELAREVLRFVAAGDEADLADARRRLGMEMYDVVWNVCDLATPLASTWTTPSPPRRPSTGDVVENSLRSMAVLRAGDRAPRPLFGTAVEPVGQARFPTRGSSRRHGSATIGLGGDQRCQ